MAAAPPRRLQAPWSWGLGPPAGWSAWRHPLPRSWRRLRERAARGTWPDERGAPCACRGHAAASMAGMNASWVRKTEGVATRAAAGESSQCGGSGGGGSGGGGPRRAPLGRRPSAGAPGLAQLPCQARSRRRRSNKAGATPNQHLFTAQHASRAGVQQAQAKQPAAATDAAPCRLHAAWNAPRHCCQRYAHVI